MTTHTRKWKESEVARLTQLAKEYPVIGVADLKGFPASLHGSLKVKLAGKAVLTVSKRKVIQHAFRNAGIDSSLVDNVKGSSAVLFTKTNPFELFSLVKQSSGKVSAKEGQLAPEDIVIPAGDTGLPPGPALSDLKGAGLNVRVQGATIAVVEDKVVTKKGEPVTKPVISVLGKFGIKPIKLRLSLTNVLENGTIYPASVLDIDEEAVFNQFVRAEQQAFNLSVNAGIYTDKSIPVILGKAFREAKAVAIEANVITSETAVEVLGKAQRAAVEINSQLKEDTL
ncbi:MAG: 50S ribosomal protein L10 [Candidatus Diapherotrites archaeon]